MSVNESLDELFQLFSAGEIKGLLQKLESGVRSPDLLYGPLIRSKYTYELESLFRYIVSDSDKVKLHVEGTPGEYIATVTVGDQVETFNISRLLQYGNLNHITLTEPDMKLYQEYLREKSWMKPARAGEVSGQSAEPDENYFNARDTGNDLVNLAFAEKTAINIYTGPFFTHMNGLFRGNISPKETFNGDVAEAGKLKDALVHSIMAISGLNKIPSTPVPTGSLRGERFFSQGVLDTRIRAAESKSESDSVTTERAFTSTTTAGVTYTGKIRILYSNVFGKMVTPLSQAPSESEFLLPPTQIAWRAHLRAGDAYVFHATAVRTLSGLPPQASEPKEIIKSKEVKSEVEHILRHSLEIGQRYQGRQFGSASTEQVEIALRALTANTLLETTLEPLKELDAIEDRLSTMGKLMAELQSKPMLSQYKTPKTKPETPEADISKTPKPPKLR